MPNPALNDKVFQEAAAPPRPTPAGRRRVPRRAPTTQPITDGPATPYRSDRTGVMTVGGTAAATGVLLVLLIVAGAVGWNFVSVDADSQTVNFPGWILLPLFGALGRRLPDRVQAPPGPVHWRPLYAILQGLVVGAISHVYNAQWDGIVIQAVGATDRPCSPSCSPSTGCASSASPTASAASSSAPPSASCSSTASRFLFSLFGHTPSFLYDSSLFGIGLSVLVAGVAAFNLALDFDMIERGAKVGAPRYMEWYGAFGLLVTLVWLYLELLRLLARLRSR